MRRICIAAAIVIVVVFLFAGKVYAADGKTLIVKYYDAQLLTNELRIELVGNFSQTAMAAFVYTNLFEDCEGINPAFIPKGVRFLGAEITGGELVIDVSKEMLSYGGGTAYESALISIIIENAKQFDGVTTVTLLVDGKQADMPEGTNVYKTRIK